jgi:hypothetical protein
MMWVIGGKRIQILFPEGGVFSFQLKLLLHKTSVYCVKRVAEHDFLPRINPPGLPIGGVTPPGNKRIVKIV